MINYSYVNNKVKLRLESLEHKDLEQRNTLGYESVENGVILPWKETGDNLATGGVLQPDGQFVIASANEDTHLYKGAETEECAVERNETVIYIGNMIPVWGHSITDNLKKIWFLKTGEGMSLLKKGVRLVYIIQFGRKIPHYMKDLLAMADVPISLVEEINVPTRFKRIIIPDNAIAINDGLRYYHRAYMETIEMIVQKVDSKYSVKEGIGKIYFTRTKLTSNRDKGEVDLEHVFSELGYSIISPEQHDLVEQIGMLRNCEVFATIEGSISHSAIFCRPNTNVIILRKADWVNKYQIMINQAANLDVTYIDAHHSVRNNKSQPWAGPFYLCVTSYLEKFVGHKIPRKPLWLRKDWLWYYFGKYKVAHMLNSVIHRIFLN